MVHEQAAIDLSSPSLLRCLSRLHWRSPGDVHGTVRLFCRLLGCINRLVLFDRRRIRLALALTTAVVLVSLGESQITSLADDTARRFLYKDAEGKQDSSVQVSPSYAPATGVDLGIHMGYVSMDRSCKFSPRQLLVRETVMCWVIVVLFVPDRRIFTLEEDFVRS